MLEIRGPREQEPPELQAVKVPLVPLVLPGLPWWGLAAPRDQPVRPVRLESVLPEHKVPQVRPELVLLVPQVRKEIKEVKETLVLQVRKAFKVLQVLEVARAALQVRPVRPVL